MGFYIPNYDSYRTDRDDGHKGRAALTVKQTIPHTCVDLPPLLSVEGIGICITIGNAEMFRQIFTNLRKDCGVEQTS
jgi:hypothetical protein